MKKSKQFRPTAFIVSAKLKVNLLLLLMAMLVPQGAWALGGSGTSSSPYTIANASDLVAFASKVNGGETGAYAKLTADITLTSAWTPIGNSSKIYTGTFDGNGKTISGLNLTATAANAGLFGYVNGATIKNFSLAGSVSSNSDNVGSVVGYAKGSSTIQDIVSTVNITMTAAKSHLGGIAGNIENGTSVLGCTYSGTLNAGSSTDSNGGIVGFANANCSGTIKYCFFNGTVKTTGSGPQMGGILGYTNDESSNFGGVQNCYSCGTLTYSGSDTHVNAIVGRIRNRATTTINNTYLSGIATRACNTDGPSIPASNKAITISVSTNNASMARVDRSYVNPTSTTPTQLRLDVVLLDWSRFVKWNDNNTEDPRIVSLANDINLKATVDYHYLNLNLSCDSEKGTVTGGGSYVTGSYVTISATAKPGYRFVGWSDGNLENPRNYELSTDMDLIAEFAPAFTITVSSNNDSWGKAVTHEVASGVFIIEADANHGYHFVRWNDGSTVNVRHFYTLERDESFQAIFAPDQYNITVNVANGQSGMGTVSGGGTFDYGTKRTITATPKTHYHFVQWSDGNTNASRQITVEGDATYTATFAIDQHTISVQANNNNYGTVGGGGTFDYNSSKTITATPKNHYHFVQWSDGNTNASRQITVNGNATYTATFAIDQHTITVQANNNNYGTVSGGGTFDYNSSKTITATPKEHYYFVQWNDGDTNASRQITVEDDATYTATFAPKAKAVLNNGTLTFYYDDKDHDGTTYPLNTGTSNPKWFGSSSTSISTVVFDASFADARPTSCYYWFYNCSNLTSITGLEYLNTSEVTSMTRMFLDCSQLTSLDLSSFNTSSVTSMTRMFYGCSQLTSLDLSSFNTSSVTSMAGMFFGCSRLTSLDLSSFNTINVEYMNEMFYGCSQLTSLDLSNFNTANVEYMYHMFNGCSKLASLDLSNFNTANVTDMYYMFNGCSQLTSLDLSNFNTANVTSMGSMFQNCSNLQSLTIGNFDMTKARASNMFEGCSNLNNLTMKSLPFLQEGTFDTQFSGDGKTVNVILDDNSDIYTGANNLPAPATSTATFNREIVADGGMYSFIVPFDIPAGQAAQLGTFYQYRTHEGGQVHFDNIARVGEGIVRANTAYFFKPARDITSFTVENPAFDTTGTMPDATNPSVPGLYGTYSPIEVPVGAYGYVVHDGQSTFVKAGTGNLLRTFRAYLWLGSGASMARAHAIRGQQKGDVNGDGKISLADLSLLIEILNGRATDTTGNADVDGKNGVTIDDLKILRNHILGLLNIEDLYPEYDGQTPGYQTPTGYRINYDDEDEVPTVQNSIWDR